MRGSSCRRLLLAVLAALAAPAATLHAQDRFELLGHDVIAHIPDVTIDTVRDKRTATCFAIFSGASRSGAGSAVGTSGTIAPRVRDVPPPPRPRDEGADLAESLRRALVDPATVQAMSMPVRDALTRLDDRLRHIESLLEQIASSRFAIWPVSCDTTVNR
jgi:hypothetical protein